MLDIVALTQTALVITNVTTYPAILSFDYQSNASGKFLLKDCWSEFVQLEVVSVTNSSTNQYKHVEWKLPTYCSNYSMLMDSWLVGNVIIRNGWLYQPKTILNGEGYLYLVFENGGWKISDSRTIGNDYYSNCARLQFHYSPITGWMNDPNGLVYHNGLYHLYYQYNPYQSHWSNMHWGHAVSTDLISWLNLPIAIYPNPELNNQYMGGIFTGSALYRSKFSIYLSMVSSYLNVFSNQFRFLNGSHPKCKTASSSECTCFMSTVM